MPGAPDEASAPYLAIVATNLNKPTMSHTLIQRSISKRALLGAALAAGILSGCANKFLEGSELYGIDILRANEAPVIYMDYKIKAGSRLLYSWDPELLRVGRYSGGGYSAGFNAKPSLIYIKWKNQLNDAIHEVNIPFGELYGKSLKNKDIEIVSFKDEIAVFVVGEKELKKDYCPEKWPFVKKEASDNAVDWFKKSKCLYAVEQVYPINQIIYPEE